VADPCNTEFDSYVFKGRESLLRDVRRNKTSLWVGEGWDSYGKTLISEHHF
jgi:hypothetical protein